MIANLQKPERKIIRANRIFRLYSLLCLIGLFCLGHVISLRAQDAPFSAITQENFNNLVLLSKTSLDTDFEGAMLPRLSSDGTRAVIGNWNLSLNGDSTITVFDTLTGEVIKSLQYLTLNPRDVDVLLEQPPRTVTLNHDGTLVAASGEGPAFFYIWDAASGEEVARHRIGQGYLYDIVFSEDDKTIIITGGAGFILDVQIDGFQPRFLPVIGSNGGENIAYRSGDDMIAISRAYDRSVFVFHADELALETLVPAFELKDAYLAPLVLHPDLPLLAVNYDQEFIELWDYDQEERIARFPVKNAQRIAFNAAGDVVAVSDDSGSVRVWAIEEPDADPVILDGHTGAVDVTFTDDGVLVTADMDAVIRHWGLENTD